MKPFKPALTLAAFALTFLVAATLGADAQRDNRSQPTLEAVASSELALIPALAEHGGMAFDRRPSEGNPMFCSAGAEGPRSTGIRSWFRRVWDGVKKVVRSIRCGFLKNGFGVQCKASF